MKKFYKDAIKMLREVEDGEWKIKQVFDTLEKSSWTKDRDDSDDIPGLSEVMEDFESTLKELKPLIQEVSGIWDKLSSYVDEIEEMGLEDGWLEQSDLED